MKIILSCIILCYWVMLYLLRYLLCLMIIANVKSIAKRQYRLDWLGVYSIVTAGSNRS